MILRISFDLQPVLEGVADSRRDLVIAVGVGNMASVVLICFFIISSFYFPSGKLVINWRSITGAAPFFFASLRAFIIKDILRARFRIV